MSCKRASKRSLDDWMEMVTACRQSGMTDADWCAEHEIAPSSFYNAVTRLRKQACQIPDPIKKVSTLDLTSRKQDVVRIAGTGDYHNALLQIPAQDHLRGGYAMGLSNIANHRITQ